MHKSFTFLVKVFSSLQRITRNAFKYIGLPFVYGGVICLALFYATGLTNYNILSILPVIAIFFGIAGYVKGEKRKSLY